MKTYKGDSRAIGFILQDKTRMREHKVFVYYNNEKLTYGALNEKSNRIANTFVNKLGVKKGDRIAIMFPNCPDYIIMQFATAKTGAIQVPINIQAPSSLIAHFLNNSEPNIIVLDQQFLSLFKSGELSLKKLPLLIVRSSQPVGEGIPLEKDFRIFPYQELFSGSSDAPQIKVKRVDPIAIFYTSGTTGVSKGVVLSHNHHYTFSLMLAEMGRLTPEDIFYTCLPYYHGISQYMVTLPALLAEGSVALAERFSSSKFWDDIKQYKATATYMVYTMPSILVKAPEAKKDKEHSLRVVYTAGIAPEIHEAFENRFGVVVLNPYGSTEQSALSYTPYDKHKYGGATGEINDRWFKVKIVNDEDEELLKGEVGEIVSRSKKPYTQMTEYYRMPEATVEAFRNRWLHSGDLGFIDKDNWLYFTGRAKDAIRRRGENISASELESIINSHPSIKECAAIPIPGELGEDEIKVVVVLREEETLPIQSFLTFCEKHMPKHMIPRFVEFKQALPKTSTEKVQKAKLMEEGLTPNTWDREKGAFHDT